MNKLNVQVGVGVLILKEGRILLGERLGSHGAGTWGLPGGHLEFGESIESCAKREVLEETGLDIVNVRNAAFTNDIFELEEKHYVTLFVLAEYRNGDPKIVEPEQCRVWDWFSWDHLPEPLFIPLLNLRNNGFTLPI